MAPAECPANYTASDLDLTALSDSETLLFEYEPATGYPSGVYYVTEGGLHLTEGAKCVIKPDSGASIAFNPFTVRFEWRSREPHNEDGSLTPFEGVIARIPMGEL